jgi:ABC-2 type transport system permease protein
MITDFTPQPGAATLGRRALSQARMEARLMLRNGEQLLLALVIPLALLVGGSYAIDRSNFLLSDTPVNLITPGVLALAVMSTSFTSLAISSGFERRAGLLRRLAVSPLGWDGLLVGKLGAVLAVQAIQIALISVVAFVMGWRPELRGLAVAVPIVIAGTAAFAGLGLALAGTFRAEATLAVANLVNLILMIGGGILIGGWPIAADCLRFLPSAALGDAMRAALIDGEFSMLSAVTLSAWAGVGAACAARWFKWD